ncbi:hypothetical protein TSOC_003206 [Tetrabaena socialis]|uniref:Uncharacterized protein n=1 Tax=Tetrabaena socialis TaxID=47790 RepID=A0A2J8AC43_9CHLO|nr:hypothetical protein TSOC_003206 [Tetrabaena socialis]|eukprot:PNH10098.1 hypothetical protein TSOC_003206 [Tetrabaena socialis]
MVIDDSPCVTFNADDASPVLDGQGVIVGYTTVHSNKYDSQGLSVLRLDVVAVMSNLYFASPNSSMLAGATNIRAKLSTDLPTACPSSGDPEETYSQGVAVDCSKRRATLDISVPTQLFNCTSGTTEDFDQVFFLQLEVELASQTCAAAKQPFYSGGLWNQITPGCTYVMVTASCKPSTCLVDTSLPAEQLLSAALGSTGRINGRPVQRGNGSFSTGLSGMRAALLGGLVGGLLLVSAVVIAFVLFRRSSAAAAAERNGLRRSYSVSSDYLDGDKYDSFTIDTAGGAVGVGGVAVMVGRKPSRRSGGSKLSLSGLLPRPSVLRAQGAGRWRDKFGGGAPGTAAEAGEVQLGGSGGGGNQLLLGGHMPFSAMSNLNASMTSVTYGGYGLGSRLPSIFFSPRAPSVFAQPHGPSVFAQPHGAGIPPPEQLPMHSMVRSTTRRASVLMTAPSVPMVLGRISRQPTAHSGMPVGGAGAIGDISLLPPELAPPEDASSVFLNPLALMRGGGGRRASRADSYAPRMPSPVSASASAGRGAPSAAPRPASSGGSYALRSRSAAAASLQPSGASGERAEGSLIQMVVEEEESTSSVNQEMEATFSGEVMDRASAASVGPLGAHIIGAGPIGEGRVPAVAPALAGSERWSPRASAGTQMARQGQGLRSVLPRPPPLVIPPPVDAAAVAALEAASEQDDAAPILGPGNSTLGWATIQQSSVDLSGVAAVQIDLTAHVSAMFLADSSASQADASNVRVCLMTDVPDACPVTSQLMYHKADSVDCSKRRATVDVTVPPHIFNCSYATPAEYSATFYVQLEVDLASEECLPPEGSFFAGSRRGAISDGCSYITITATCIPSTCETPILSIDDGSSTNTVAGLSKNLLPVIVGVSVGTAAVILAILGSVFYIRKRRLEESVRRKMQRRFSGAVVADSPGSTDTEDADELDFSGRSVTALGRRASVFMGGSALFSRTPRSTMARHASGLMSEQSPSFLMAQAPYEQHPGERLRQQGAVRFADKYNDPQHGGEGSSVRAGATPSSTRGGATYGSAGSAALRASSGDSMAFTGHGSAEIVSAEVDLREDSTGQPLRYQLARMSAKMADFRSPRSPPLPAPAAAVTFSPGRTMAQMASDLGFDRPWESPTTAESHASLAMGAQGSMFNAEMVPESASAFINPLAMMDEDDGLQSSEGDSSGEEYQQISGGGGGTGGARHVTYSSGGGYMPYGGGSASYGGSGGRAPYSSGGNAGGGSMRAATQMKTMSAAATGSRPNMSPGSGASYGGGGYYGWQQQQQRMQMQVDEGVETDSSEELQASERRRRPGAARRASQMSALDEGEQLSEGPTGGGGDQGCRHEEREAVLYVEEADRAAPASEPEVQPL